MQAYTLKHPKTQEIMPLIETIKKMTENDKIPFDPNPILKILISFDEHFEGRPDPPQIPNFTNIHWKLLEKQQNSGFIISPDLKEMITNHRSNLKPQSKMETMMEELFINAY
jgi:hypothetical protein